MDILASLNKILLYAIPFLIAIVFHEVAHAAAAAYYGDNTAKNEGRITLNPIPHIDPMGLICFIGTAMFTPFVFGWAKPVPVNYRNFRKAKNLKNAILFVSLAGVCANFFLIIAFAICLKIYLLLVPDFLAGSAVGGFIYETLILGVMVNAMLMFFNLLPIPPLDGSHIVERFLPYPYDVKFMDMGQYGMIILILLLATGILGKLVGSFVREVFMLLIYFIR